MQLFVGPKMLVHHDFMINDMIYDYNNYYLIACVYQKVN